MNVSVTLKPSIMVTSDMKWLNAVYTVKVMRWLSHLTHWEGIQKKLCYENFYYLNIQLYNVK